MVFREFLTWFWNPDVWLPPGYEWEDVVSNDKIKYTVPTDLLYAIPIGFGMVFIRYFLEREIFDNLGIFFGIKRKDSEYLNVVENDVLEKAFKAKSSYPKKFSHKELLEFGKKTDMEVRQIERWMRKRGKQGKPTTLAKFSECCWRFTCYTISLLMGIYVLWDKSWLWDIRQCWYDYPNHNLPNDIWWYYVYGSSFYWSLLITLAYDAKRKDFWEMALHHVATLCLLSFSWVCNLTRVGTLVLLLHDVVDPILEASKICKYANNTKIGDAVSIFFIIVWILTRILIYPAHIINSTMYEAPKVIPMFAAYYIFNGMLLLLYVLHIFWTYFIALYVHRTLTTNAKLIKDSRSSSEYESESEDKNTDHR